MAAPSLLCRVAFCQFCLFALHHGAGQDDEHSLCHEDINCTMAAHSVGVAICLGTYKTGLIKYEQHENYDLCCRKTLQGTISCSPPESVDIAWPSVQDITHVEVGMLAYCIR